MAEAVQSVVEGRDAGVSKSTILDAIIGPGAEKPPSDEDKAKLRFLVDFAYSARNASEAHDKFFRWCISLENPGTQATSSPQSLLCESDEFAKAGFWADKVGGMLRKDSAALATERRKSQWRIDLRPDEGQATVTRFSGASQEVESPSAWKLEQDPLGAGIILLPAQRAEGTSPETITITASTLEFVYATQHVNPLYNRGTIWVGRCRKAP